MAVQEYIYDVATDFPNGRVHTATLRDEIVACPDITIQINDVHCVGFTEEAGGVCVGGTIHLVFAAELPTGEKTVLDGDTTGPCGGLIAAHDNSGKYDVPPLMEMTVHETALTGGGFCGKGIEILNIGSTVGWYSRTVSFPFPVDMLTGKFIGNGETEYGDLLRVEVHPDMPILTAYGFAMDVKVNGVHTAGEDTIQINLTNVAYARATGMLNIGLGKFIKFADHEQEYWVREIDPVNNWIKIHKKESYTSANDGLADDLSDGDVVKFTTIMMDGVPLPTNGICTCGESKTGSSGLPTGMPIKLMFYNSTGDESKDKKVRFTCETLYGEPVT